MVFGILLQESKQSRLESKLKQQKQFFTKTVTDIKKCVYSPIKM